ncbi:MAG: hypothetical protein AAGA56_01990 [Myxococcota bacterium]
MSPLFFPRLAAVPSAVLLLFGAPVHAEDPPFSDLAGREPIAEDVAPLPVPLAAPSPRGATTVSLGVRHHATAVGRRDLRGEVWLSVPTDRWLLPSSRKAKASPQQSTSPPSLREVSSSRDDAGSRASPAREVADRASSRALLALPRMRARDVRDAISAAYRHAGLPAHENRLDDIAARARWSAVLPELRLRATRLTDESASLSPTSYDSERITSRGGVSLWLEGRATWRLDRLVLADEEVRLERHRERLQAQRQELGREILSHWTRWRRHLAALRSPLTDTLACLDHSLKLDEEAVTLDLLTGGWFARYERERTSHSPDCRDEVFTREPPAHRGGKARDRSRGEVMRSDAPP